MVLLNYPIRNIRVCQWKFINGSIGIVMVPIIGTNRIIEWKFADPFALTS